jgi:hypothetical protein
MRTPQFVAAILGIGAGIALHVYSRSGNGWEVGPGTLLGVAGLLAGMVGGGACVAIQTSL